MKTVITFFFCLTVLFISNSSYSSSSASIKELGNQQEHVAQLKKQLGAKRYNRLVKKIDRKSRKREISPNDQANIAFFLSIISIFLFPLALVSLFIGANAKKRMRIAENYEGEGLAKAAIIISIAILIAVAIIIGIFFVSIYGIM